MSIIEQIEIRKEEVIFDQYRIKKTYSFLKRSMDIICSLFGLIFLSPLLLMVAACIKIESKGSAIFTQNRVGLEGKVFKLYKLRSMVNNAEELKWKLEKNNEMDGPMFKIRNDPRVTKVGRFIRKTSIDELPQLVNVLKGEMSLVGPRPSLQNEVEEFENWMLKRLAVKPGLTCYWQVSGRNDIEFKEWMELDIKYIKERSIWIDIKLILKTVFVLSGDRHAR